MAPPPWKARRQARGSGKEEWSRTSKGAAIGTELHTGSVDIAPGVQAGIPLFCVSTRHEPAQEDKCHTGGDTYTKDVATSHPELSFPNPLHGATHPPTPPAPLLSLPVSYTAPVELRLEAPKEKPTASGQQVDRSRHTKVEVVGSSRWLITVLTSTTFSTRSRSDKTQVYWRCPQLQAGT